MRRVLVAVDGSPRSLHVLDTGAKIARENGARLRLLHVAHVPLDFPSALWVTDGATLEDHATRIGRELVGELAKEVPKERLAGTDVRLGRPWSVICDVAKEFDADLIVIGAHGYGVVERALGTTAAGVVNNADRDVLVVRDRAK